MDYTTQMAGQDPSTPTRLPVAEKDVAIYAGTRSSLLFHAYHFISIHFSTTAHRTPTH